MLSATSEYAIRALIDLTRHEAEWPIPGPVIAERAGIPQRYLSKILGDLVRAGQLEGSRGKNGGFRMTRSPKDIRLSEVLIHFEPISGNRRECPFGNTECSDLDPCAGHHRWKVIREAYERFLRETSVYDVAFKESEHSIGNSGSKRKAL